MEARQGGDGLPAPFTTAPVPGGKSPAGRHNRKKSWQDSDISHYTIGMAIIGNGNGNGNAVIIARTVITPTS